MSCNLRKAFISMSSSVFIVFDLLRVSTQVQLAKRIIEDLVVVVEVIVSFLPARVATSRQS